MSPLYFFSMSVIKILEYGLGDDGKTLELKIAVPHGYLLEHMCITTSDVYLKTNSFTELNIMEVIADDYDLPTLEDTFDTLFSFVESNATEDIYVLKNDFTIFDKTGLQLDNTKLTFLHFKMQDTYVGEGNTLVLPIYDSTALKLDALNYVDLLKNCKYCSVNKEFKDRLLQINALELALSSNEYKFASQIWEAIQYTKPNNKCSCNEY